MEGRIFQGRVRAGNCRVRITMHVRQHSRLLKRKREGKGGGGDENGNGENLVPIAENLLFSCITGFCTLSFAR